MANRSSPVPLQHGPPRPIGSLEELAQRAAEHARVRLFTACEAIAMIATLATQWKKPWTPELSLVRANIQDGSAGTGEQAAHVLPGQILIDGKKPWSIARDDRAIVAFLARFEVTAAVPTAFNVADSQAEKSGLKTAFLRACESAWASAVGGKRDLTPVFATFLEEANRSFERAILSKREKSTAAMRRGAQNASDDRTSEGLILRFYGAHGVTAREASRYFGVGT